MLDFKWASRGGLVMSQSEVKVFISYIREDYEIAKRLCDDLEQQGIDVWLDTKRLEGGCQWDIEIEKEINERDYFISLLSSRTVEKEGFFHKELELALERQEQKHDSKKFIVPVLIDDCEESYSRLRKIQMIKIFPLSSYNTALNQLINTLMPKNLRYSKIRLEESFREADQYRNNGEYEKAIRVYIDTCDDRIHSGVEHENIATKEEILQRICDTADELSVESYEKAFEAYQKVLGIEPHYPEALYGQATLYYKQRKYQKAIRRYKRYCREVKKENSSKELEWGLEKICEIGDILFKERKYTEALDIYLDTKDIDPEYDLVWDRIDEAQRKLEQEWAHIGRESRKIIGKIEDSVSIINESTKDAKIQVEENLIQQKCIVPSLEQVLEEAACVNRIIYDFRQKFPK